MAKQLEVGPLEIDRGDITPETLDNLMRRDAKICGMIIRKNKEIEELRQELKWAKDDALRWREIAIDLENSLYDIKKVLEEAEDV